LVFALICFALLALFCEWISSHVFAPQELSRR